MANRSRFRLPIGLANGNFPGHPLTLALIWRSPNHPRPERKCRRLRIPLRDITPLAKPVADSRASACWVLPTIVACFTRAGFEKFLHGSVSHFLFASVMAIETFCDNCVENHSLLPSGSGDSG